MAEPDDSARAPRAPAATSLAGFAARVLVAIALIALAAMLWVLKDVVLLLFAAVLIAVILRAAAAGLRRVLPLGETPALVLAGLLILAVLVGAAAIFGRELGSQMASLGELLPRAMEQLRDWLGEQRLRTLADRLLPGGEAIRAVLQTVVSVTIAALTGLILAVVGGIYLAAHPEPYRRGALLMLPHRARPHVERAFGRIGTAMKQWLAARLAAMLIIGVITFIGLKIIGVPSALALALIAGLLEFVPIVGPILAAIPALLLALTLGTQTFIATLVLYVAIQQFEGNIVTPVAMRQAIEIPPAVTLFALFLFGVLFGTVGVLLAGPLTVLVYVGVRVLWVKETLGDDVGTG